jgi:hypothetical protein
MHSIKEAVRSRLAETAVPPVAYATRIPLVSLYVFRKGKKELSINNYQKLCDYFGLELRSKNET